jgi:biopolymer transport protein ExbD
MSRLARNRRSSRTMRDEASIQITSMADVFMILLVFLLKTFSTGLNNITPSNDVILPVAHSEDGIAEALKIEITPNNILVDDHPITMMKDYRPDDTDIEGDGSPRSLNTALMHERKRNPASADSTSSLTSQVLVLADQNTPFITIRSVMTAAEHSGFKQFKLVVVEDQ